MSQGFADAVDVLHLDPTGSVAGAFTARPSPPGERLLCRAIVWRTDPRITAGRTGAQAPAVRASIQKSEVPTRPRAEDMLEVLEGPLAGVYRVHRVTEVADAPAWHFELGVWT